MQLKLEEKETRKKRVKLVPYYAVKPIKFSFFLSFMILLVSAIFYSMLQPEIPLFYSLANTSSQLAPKIFIFTLPLISILFNIINIFFIRLSKQIHLEHTIIKLYAWSCLMLQIIFTMILARIIFIIS